MDAQADYTAVALALARPLLPYVSYVVHSHAGFDALHLSDSQAIVVRSSDGKIVSGTLPKIELGAGDEREVEVIRHPPFDPTCCAGSHATLTTFESQPVEAIALQRRCRDRSGDLQSHDPTLRTLYVEPATHRPIAVVGDDVETYVSAHLEQRFHSIDGFVVPTQFNVKVLGAVRCSGSTSTPVKRFRAFTSRRLRRLHRRRVSPNRTPPLSTRARSQQSRSGIETARARRKAQRNATPSAALR